MSAVTIAGAGAQTAGARGSASRRTGVQDAGAARAVRGRMRLTVRGRRVLATLLALPVAAALSWGIVSTSGALGGDAFGGVEPAGPSQTVQVGGGESLWSVAERVAPSRDPRDVVIELQQVNRLPSSTLQPGQMLEVPASITR